MSHKDLDHTTLVERARKMFDHFDKDASGAIDAWELKQAMKDLGFVMTDGEILHLIITLGAREDAPLDFAMFLQLCLNQAQIVDQRWKKVSETMDAFCAVGGGDEGAGSIDKSKIMEAVENFELEIDTEPLLKSIDANGDGAVNFQEFSEFLHADNEDVDTNLHREGNRWLRHNINDVMDMHATANLNLVLKERDMPRAVPQRQVDGTDETAGGVDKDDFARLKWLEQLDRQFHAKLRSNRQKQTEKRRKVLKMSASAKQGQYQTDTNAMPKSVMSQLVGENNASSPFVRGLGRTSSASASGQSSPFPDGAEQGYFSSSQPGTPTQPKSVSVKSRSAVPSHLQDEVRSVMFPPPRAASFRHALDNPSPKSKRTPGSGRSLTSSSKGSDKGSATPIDSGKSSPRVALP